MYVQCMYASYRNNNNNIYIYIYLYINTCGFNTEVCSKSCVQQDLDFFFDWFEHIFYREKANEFQLKIINFIMNQKNKEFNQKIMKKKLITRAKIFSYKGLLSELLKHKIKKARRKAYASDVT